MSDTQPPINIQVRQPAVPTAFASIPQIDTIRGKYLRVVMSREEYDLYVITWNEWLTDHQDDYTMAEDFHDLHRICMETVMQFRLDLLKRNNPNYDITEDYNQSCRRMQQARENLAARRVDRVGTKDGKKGNTTFNVAIMAGQVDPDTAARREQAIKGAQNDVFKFLESTVTGTGKPLPSSKFTDMHKPVEQLPAIPALNADSNEDQERPTIVDQPEETDKE